MDSNLNYHGTLDPHFHLCIFSDEVSLITMDSNLHVKLFPISLKGNAIYWFHKLLHTSIENYQQLKTTFYIHYQIYVAKKVTFSDLMLVKQREG